MIKIVPVSERFRRLLAEARERRAERIRNAPLHKCVPIAGATCSRVTGRGGLVLKRPVIVKRLYECKICGRDMEPKKNGRGRQNPRPTK